MNLPSGLNYDFIKTIATMLCPGALAIAPYCAVLANRWPAARTYMHENPTLALVTLLLAVVATGMILEDLGSEIESRVLDQGPDAKKRLANWRAYLRLAFDKEPIGQHYLVTLVARMKFEISMLCAVPICVIGLCWCNVRTNFLTVGEVHVLTVAGIVITGFFWYSADESCKLLANVRDLLLKGVTVSGVVPEAGADGHADKANPNR